MPTPAGFAAPIAEEIWNRKYRLRDAAGTPRDADLDATFRRVAEAAAAAEKGGKRVHERWARRFHEAIADMGFLPGGRILAGAGAKRAVTLLNCFVMGRIEDDLASIFEHVKEAALTMQQGGGIGHDFSTLRPQGALVQSIGADASGPVSFMDVWDAMCRTIMSAGARRGAMMATLRCDHPDIEAFIDAKRDPARLRNFNLSVLVTDAFLAAVEADARWDLVFAGKVYRTVSARALWERLMRATYEVAEPGVIFIDRINAENNLAYCEAIHATNPCVTADTWILTDSGPHRVAELVGADFKVAVDGHLHVAAPGGFFATGDKAVVRVETEEGYSLRLTPDHLVRKVGRRTRWSADLVWERAGSLAPGDEIVIHNHRSMPSWGNTQTSGRDFKEGFLLGLLIGDGTLKQDKAVLSAWRPAACVGEATGGSGVDGVMREAVLAAAALGHRADFRGWQHVNGRSEWRLSTAALKQLADTHGLRPGDKHVTAELECRSTAFYRGLLRGLFDTDGSVQGTHRNGISIRLAQSDLEDLQAVQRMLLRLGIASTIYRDRREPGFKDLPDGRGGSRPYAVRAQHELVISRDNIAEFATQIGFSDTAKADRLKVLASSYRRSLNREPFVATVARVVPAGVETVYDVSVPGCNAFDANGLYVHNCGEQPLPAYGACLLGSINLAQLIERPFTAGAAIDTARLEQRVAVAVRFLDDVIEVSGYPLERQRQEAKAKRRLGLGITGLADALILAGVHYDSPRGRELAAAWMQSIQRAAYLASAELAREKGAFPLYDADRFLAAPNVVRLGAEVAAAIHRSGIRNGCLTSIAPTGTISLFAGNVSSGIEPVYDFRYTRRVLASDGSRHEQQVEDYAHALYRRQLADPALPDAFVRAEQLSPRAHLEMQAALQPWVDSAISKTINCPETMPFEAFADVYLEAYRMGLKGCTTYRPNPVTGAVLAPIAAGGEPPTTPAAVGSGGEPAVSVARARPAPQLQPAVETAPTPTRAGDVVYMAKPLERDGVLSGYTYKLKWPASDHAIYVTINDIERDGRRRPFEIFINTRNLEHYAWTVALTRMISAVFRRGGDVTFVAEELKAVFDPQGGQWLGGRYVPSLLAAIGEVIETHMVRTGFLQAGAEPLGLGEAVEPRLALPVGAERPATAAGGRTQRAPPKLCPRCASADYLRQEGCWVCRSCGFSRCG